MTHKFHYHALNDLDASERQRGSIYTVRRGKGITGECGGWLYKNLLASYAQLIDTAPYHGVRRFVAFIQPCNKPERHAGTGV